MRRFFSILRFAWDRLWVNRILAFWALVGLVTAITLALSLPLYVDAVYENILEDRLDEPPYAFRFRYLGAWNGNIAQVDYESATVAIADRFAQDIDLPLRQSIRYVRGGTWNTRKAGNPPVNLGALGLAAIQGLEPQITISGEWDNGQELESNAIPVMIPETMFYNFGVQIGDTIQGQSPGLPIQDFEVVATWRPINEDDPEWIFPPKFFDQVIFVQEDDLWQLLSESEDPLDETAWYLNFDGSTLLTSEVSDLVGIIGDGQRDIEEVLPGVRLDVSPEDNLRAFTTEVNELTQQLYIILMPVAGLVIYFVALIAGLLVNRQKIEDVKLRSRGMSRLAVLGIHFVMWFLLVAIALGIAIFLSPYLVRLIGQTTSFLQFENTENILTVTITPNAILIGILTGVLAASSGLFIAWRTTRQNVNTILNASGANRQAWWQRAYVDLMILAPALYVLYTLWEQGGLAGSAASPFSNPLTFVGPTLFALGWALFFLRLLPWLFGLAASFWNLTANIPILMAFRELNRSIGNYRGTLLMMAFTLSLTGFTASMASTLDESLVDSINYDIGADIVIVAAAEAQTESDGTNTQGQATFDVTGYNPPPVQDLWQVPGITNISRVGTYTARLRILSRVVDGSVMGVDRAEIAAVTYYREDYAPNDFALVFNKLAGNRTGIIVNRQTAEENNLALGQELELQINALNEWYDLRVPVVDVFDFFPTLNPTDGFVAITNIDPLFEAVGTDLPFNIWLGIEPGYDPQDVINNIREIGFPILSWEATETAIQAAQSDPSRQGVLGFLSVGFVASITLTLISAIIQSIAAFRTQAVQLGSLRAMGLGSLSVAVYMILLQSLVSLAGIASGTSIGFATTLLYLPVLDFSGGLPPYLVRVSWEEILIVYGIFAAILFAVTLLTSLMLSREQLASVVKLGNI